MLARFTSRPRWNSGGLNEDFVHEGILGTTFTGRLLRETESISSCYFCLIFASMRLIMKLRPNAFWAMVRGR